MECSFQLCIMMECSSAAQYYGGILTHLLMLWRTPNPQLNIMVKWSFPTQYYGRILTTPPPSTPPPTPSTLNIVVECSFTTRYGGILIRYSIIWCDIDPKLNFIDTTYIHQIGPMSEDPNYTLQLCRRFYRINEVSKRRTSVSSRKHAYIILTPLSSTFI